MSGAIANSFMACTRTTLQAAYLDVNAVYILFSPAQSLSTGKFDNSHL
jgi:hypothetical protein